MTDANTASRHLTGEVHVIPAVAGPIDRLGEVGAVDEQVEVRTGFRRLEVVDDRVIAAPRQIDAETRPRAIHIGFGGPEQRHVMVSRQALGDRAIDLLTAAERRPVEVTDRDAQPRGPALAGRGHRWPHLSTCQDIGADRSNEPMARRLRTIAGSRPRYERVTCQRRLTSTRAGSRRVSGRITK